MSADLHGGEAGRIMISGVNPAADQGNVYVKGSESILSAHPRAPLSSRC